MNRLFGWDLPPGVSQRMIDDAYGGGDPSPEAEAVAIVMEEGIVSFSTDLSEDQTRHLDKMVERVTAEVEKLAEQKRDALAMLHSAYLLLPDPVPPPCTCDGSSFSYCELHDGGDPPLKTQIQTFLKSEGILK